MPNVCTDFISKAGKLSALLFLDKFPGVFS